MRRGTRLVRLDELRARKPHQMSGGQQQRVALARALVLEPARAAARRAAGCARRKVAASPARELRRCSARWASRRLRHARPGGSADDDRPPGRDERRSHRADRRPAEVYDEPANKYVADFLGLANLLDVTAPRPTAPTRTVLAGPEPGPRAQRPRQAWSAATRARSSGPRASTSSLRVSPDHDRVPGLVERVGLPRARRPRSMSGSPTARRCRSSWPTRGREDPPKRRQRRDASRVPPEAPCDCSCASDETHRRRATSRPRLRPC